MEERILEIMKPFYDKQGEMTSTENGETIGELKSRLESLEKQKEAEIEEYINNAVNDRMDSYANGNMYINPGYVNRIRRDLEASYKEREDELKREIEKTKSFNHREKVYMELLDVSTKVRQNLYKEQKRLETELIKAEIAYSEAKIEVLKLELVLNNSAYSKDNMEKYHQLRENRVQAQARIQQIKDAQDKIRECMEITTNIKAPRFNDDIEEINEIKVTQNNEEEKPLDISKPEKDIDIDVSELQKPANVSLFDENNNSIENKSINDEPVSDTDITIETVENKGVQDIDNEETETNNEVNIENSNDRIDIDDSYVPDYTVTRNGKFSVNTTDDLYKFLYQQVMDEIDDLKTVKLSPSQGDLGLYGSYVSVKDNNISDYREVGTINLSDKEELLQLPNGEYVNSRDLDIAFNNYRNKNKGTLYEVKETNKKYKLSFSAVKKFREALKKCSTLKLSKNETNGYEMHGKTSGEGAMYQKIGDINNSEMTEGFYLLKNDVVKAIKNVFAPTKLEWLRNLSNRLKATSENKDDISRRVRGL